MKRRVGPIEDVKKQYVRMAIESGNSSHIARKIGVSTSTFGGWMKVYRDEVEKEMSDEGISPLSDSSSTQDLQTKYDHAMKLLGEKELEVAMLRDMLKKK
ncbi:transposase [Halalkalibacter alkaliphilus]|uniref:Transposase n=1 Tax=Halalkalibacter alkaliphilus TaxID=2917993 RepID=A0A9X2CXB2_9BACI|nr:transposase [Halalkalibacter alkaliphilus]MCL7749986.1 transposase [Halalkalibacter alkaliphilus]